MINSPELHNARILPDPSILLWSGVKELTEQILESWDKRSFEIKSFIRAAFAERPEIAIVLADAAVLDERGIKVLVWMAEDSKERFCPAKRALAGLILQGLISEDDLESHSPTASQSVKGIIESTSLLTHSMDENLLAKIKNAVLERGERYRISRFVSQGTKESEALDHAEEIAAHSKTFFIALHQLTQVAYNKRDDLDKRLFAYDRICILQNALGNRLKETPVEAFQIIFSPFGTMEEHLSQLSLIGVFRGEENAIMIRAGLKNEYFRSSSLQCMAYCALDTVSPLRLQLIQAIAANEVSLEEAKKEIAHIHGDKAAAKFGSDFNKLKDLVNNDAVGLSLQQEKYLASSKYSNILDSTLVHLANRGYKVRLTQAQRLHVLALIRQKEEAGEYKPSLYRKICLQLGLKAGPSRELREIKNQIIELELANIGNACHRVSAPILFRLDPASHELIRFSILWRAISAEKSQFPYSILRANLLRVYDYFTNRPETPVQDKLLWIIDSIKSEGSIVRSVVFELINSTQDKALRYFCSKRGELASIHQVYNWGAGNTAAFTDGSNMVLVNLSSGEPVFDGKLSIEEKLECRNSRVWLVVKSGRTRALLDTKTGELFCPKISKVLKFDPATSVALIKSGRTITAWNLEEKKPIADCSFFERILALQDSYNDTLVGNALVWGIYKKNHVVMDLITGHTYQFPHILDARFSNTGNPLVLVRTGNDQEPFMFKECFHPGWFSSQPVVSGFYKKIDLIGIGEKGPVFIYLDSDNIFWVKDSEKEYKLESLKEIYGDYSRLNLIIRELTADSTMLKRHYLSRSPKFRLLNNGLFYIQDDGNFIVDYKRDKTAHLRLYSDYLDLERAYSTKKSVYIYDNGAGLFREAEWSNPLGPVLNSAIKDYVVGSGGYIYDSSKQTLTGGAGKMIVKYGIQHSVRCLNSDNIILFRFHGKPLLLTNHGTYESPSGEYFYSSKDLFPDRPEDTIRWIF